MRAMMSIGGLVGFLIGLSPGLGDSGIWGENLLRASISALAAGWLMRWWGGVWVRNWHQAHAQRTQQPEISQNSANSHV